MVINIIIFCGLQENNQRPGTGNFRDRDIHAKILLLTFLGESGFFVS